VFPVASETPIVGDGVVTIPIEPDEGKKNMAMDLPDGVGQLMMTESAGNIQASNRNTRGVFDAVMGALAGTVQSNFKDIGVLEGRSASGVFATPIAGPTNTAK
jgi:hypothetical protein